MAAGRFSLEAIFKAKDKFTRPIAKMQSKLGKFQRSAARGFHQLDAASGKFLGGLKKVGIAAGAATVAVGLGLKHVIETGADFDRTMSRVSALMGDTAARGTESFKQLKKAASSMGATTEFSATQAAEGLKFLAQAGLNADQAIAALPGAIDIATIAEVELGRASDIVTDSLGAFGLATKDATQLGKNLARVNDVIAATTSSATLDIEQMFESLKMAGPVVTSAGGSIETFAALTGVMANAGIKGSQAGTTLRSAFVRLQAPAAAGASALEELGVKVKDSQGNMRDMIDILGDINVATKDMGSAVRAEKLDAIFGKRAISGVTTLLSEGADGLRKYRESLQGATGQSKDMAAKIREDVTGSIDNLKSAFEGVVLKVFEAIQGPFTEVVDTMTDWARANREVIGTKVKEFVEDLVEALPQIVKWGRRIGIIVGIFTAVAVAVKAVTAATALWNAVLAANPFTLIAMAIVAAIALIIAFWPEISAFFVQLWEGIKSVASRIGSAVGGFVEAVWGPVKSFLVGAFEFVVGMLSIILAPTFAILKPLFAAFAAGAQFIKDNWGPISAFFSAIWEAVVGVFNFAKDAVMGVVMDNVEQFKAAWSVLTDFWSGLWGGIVDTFWAIFGPVIDGINYAVEKVQDLGKSSIGSFFGGGDDEETAEGAGSGPGRQVVTPSDRVTRSIEERNSTENVNIGFDLPPGVTAKSDRKPRGSGISMQPSGAF